MLARQLRDCCEAGRCARYAGTGGAVADDDDDAGGGGGDEEEDEEDTDTGADAGAGAGAGCGTGVSAGTGADGTGAGEGAGAGWGIERWHTGDRVLRKANRRIIESVLARRFPQLIYSHTVGAPTGMYTMKQVVLIAYSSLPDRWLTARSRATPASEHGLHCFKRLSGTQLKPIDFNHGGGSGHAHPAGGARRNTH